MLLGLANCLRAVYLIDRCKSPHRVSVTTDINSKQITRIVGTCVSICIIKLNPQTSVDASSEAEWYLLFSNSFTI